MSKPKYEKPVLSSVGLPIRRAQGFDIMGHCGQGNSAGITGGDCNSGNVPEGTIQDSCADGLNATLSCGSGNLGGLGIDDGCEDGYTIYGGAACNSGTNQS